MDKIRTAVIVDPMGSLFDEPETEVEQIVETLSDSLLFNLPIELVTWGEGAHILGDKRLDLVIIDYGGMMPGTDMPEWTLRETMKWIENRPSSLAVIWTSFTRMIYDYELKEQFGHLKNVMFRFTSKNEPLVYDNRTEDLIDDMQKWFGRNNGADQ